MIESLSDSTIYMLYYLISKYMRQYNIQADKLSDDVFNFIFLKEGNPEAIEKRTGLSSEVLRKMLEEVFYFYPLDSRNSGRDLVPNHLTFFIFNHAAVLPRELWPRQIVVNGSVLMEGKKMSKSLGNIIPLREAIKVYGADPLRLSILATAEILQDANFSHSLTESIKSQLESFYSLALDIIKMREEAGEGLTAFIDRWMMSRLQHHIKAVTKCLEKLRVREAVQNAFFLLNRDIQWYLRRTQVDLSDSGRRKAIAKLLNVVLDVHVQLLTPFTPHLCEEIWNRMGREGFVSTAPWPQYEEGDFDVAALEQEEFVKSIVEDTLRILKVTGIAIERICYYTSAEWKWDAYLKALEMAEKGYVSPKELMLTVSKKPKETAKNIVEIAKAVNELSPQGRQRKKAIGVLDELKIIHATKRFLETEFKTKVDIYSEEDPNRHDPKERSKGAMPYRPAIYLE